MSESREIISAHMYLLHEWSFRIHHPSPLKYSVDLLHTPVRVDDVLEHRLNYHSVKCFIGEGNIVRIAHQGCERTE